MFLLDEVDKAQSRGGNGGNTQDALLYLLENRNAMRYEDEILLAEADISHCLYVLTANSLRKIPAPLLSRVAIAYVAPPGPEHSCILHVARHRRGVANSEWTLELTHKELCSLIGLSLREMRRALMTILGSQYVANRYTLH